MSKPPAQHYRDVLVIFFITLGAGVLLSVALYGALMTKFTLLFLLVALTGAIGRTVKYERARRSGH